MGAINKNEHNSKTALSSSFGDFNHYKSFSSRLVGRTLQGVGVGFVVLAANRYLNFTDLSFQESATIMSYSTRAILAVGVVETLVDGYKRLQNDMRGTQSIGSVDIEL